MRRVSRRLEEGLRIIVEIDNTLKIDYKTGF